MFYVAKKMGGRPDWGLLLVSLGTQPLGSWFPARDPGGARQGRVGPAGTTPSGCSARLKGFTKEELTSNYHKLEAPAQKWIPVLKKDLPT